MGNSITVRDDDYDYKFTDKEFADWKDAFLKNRFTIARNISQYGHNERHGVKEAELYWSPQDSTIKGRVYEARRIGDWNNPHRYYVKILYDGKVNTKAQLTAFNKSKGKRADSAMGNTWRKRWYTPFHFAGGKGGNRQPLGEIWKQTKKSPYDFLGIHLGILNQREGLR